MRTTRVLNWLTPRVLTPRFQATHLIVNYSLLVLTIGLYLLGVVGATAISIACLPGSAIFLISMECLAWRMVNEAENPLTLLMNLR